MLTMTVTIWISNWENLQMELLPLQPDNGASKYPSILVITPIWLHLAVISTTMAQKLQTGCNLLITMVENILQTNGKQSVSGRFMQTFW